jgi:hypothetical protein
MPEQFRALIVVLGLAIPVLLMAKAALVPSVVAPADFARRRNLWICITVIAFASHSFWIYMLAVGVLLCASFAREPNKLALYFLLLFAVPPIQGRIPGFGVVNYLFDIDHLRLLALAILLPAYLWLRRQQEVQPFGRTLPDKLLAGYLILNFLLQLRVDTLTNSLRHGVFYAFLGAFLPYYVASRSLKTLAEFREALAAFVVAALVLSAVGAFESAKHWLLYASLDNALGMYWNWGTYLERGAGALRALASTGHPIALGYTIAVALGFHLYLRQVAEKRTLWLMGLALLLAGLVAPLSRGPWVGAAALILVFVAMGRAPLRHMTGLAALAGAVLGILLATPLAGTVIDHLPFFGSVEMENITYRQRLLDVSMELIMQNPLLGSYDYIESAAMQELRQGQGIIDIVNSYVAIALWSGLVGLSLFVSVFLCVAAQIHGAMRALPDRSTEQYRLGQTLLAVLVAILLIIFTVSSITVIPVVYWAVAGLGASYARMMAARNVTVGANASPIMPAAAPTRL